jgi:hypothetical protein
MDWPVREPWSPPARGWGLTARAIGRPHFALPICVYISL